MIPVFGFTYYLYAQTDLDFSMLLDKSFGVMVGVFSGAATLAAAYIASLLFNDWRVQASFETRKNLSFDTIKLLAVIRYELLMAREKISNMKKVKEYVYLNTKCRNVEWNRLRLEIHSIYPYIKYIRKNNLCKKIDIETEYIKIDRLYTHIGDAFEDKRKSYTKYYDFMVESLNLDSTTEYSAPYSLYEKYEITSPPNAHTLLILLSSPVGFKLIDSEDKQALVEFNHLDAMIIEALSIIKNIEFHLLELCSPEDIKQGQ